LDMPDPQDLNVPFVLDYSYELPDFLIKAGDLRLFQFPDRDRTFPETSLETRRYDMVYTTSEGVHRTVELQLPPGLEVAELPVSKPVRGKHVVYRERFVLRDGVLRFESVFERKSRRIPVRDYAGYRRRLLRIEEATRKPVYFRVTQSH